MRKGERRREKKKQKKKKKGLRLELRGTVDDEDVTPLLTAGPVPPCQLTHHSAPRPLISANGTLSFCLSIYTAPTMSIQTASAGANGFEGDCKEKKEKNVLKPATINGAVTPGLTVSFSFNVLTRTEEPFSCFVS